MANPFHALLHASFLVAEVERSLKFYRDVLGMAVNPNRPDLGYPGAWLDIAPGQQIHLLQLSNPDPVSGRPEHGGRDRHVALATRDLAPIKQALERAGVGYSLSRSGRPALFCRDPDGNALEIVEQSG